MRRPTTYLSNTLVAALLAATACGDANKAADTTNTADTAAEVAAPDGVAETALDAVAETAPEDIAAEDSAPQDAAPADTSAAETVAACGPDNRRACLYRPGRAFEVQTHEVDGLTYTDVTGAERNVNIAIYRPAGAPTPQPVVLLSHGGASGKTDPMKSMEHWAPVLAEAGYFVVAIAHEGRDDPSYTALCEALAVNPLHECGVKVNWDRPNDVARVLAYLDENQRQGQFAGGYDLTRVAHVGHSAGAGAALMSVGATRNYACGLPFGYVDLDQDCQVGDLVSLVRDEIDVAIALSPQGPGTDGFMDASYATVNKPVLMATGANDGDPGEPESRMAVFPLLPAGDKYRVYVDDEGAKHTLFEGDLDACTPISGETRCTQMRAAIFSTALAFLDAYLGGVESAHAWLDSNDLVTAGETIFQFDRR